MTDISNSQLPQLPQPALPAGWYPNTNQPGYQNYWDGEKWVGTAVPIPQATLAVQSPYSPSNTPPSTIYTSHPVISSPVNKPVYLSGLTTGQNIGWLIASIFTAGLALPFWWWKAKMSRKRIS